MEHKKEGQLTVSHETQKGRAMSNWRKYRKKGLTHMRPYIPGEPLHGVHVDTIHIPKLGDMVAQTPKMYNKKWLIPEKFFKDNYEEVK